MRMCGIIRIEQQPIIGGISVFKRKIYQRLLEWKQESDGQTALLIQGARRIGKSTVAKAFAKITAS